ncbi:MAG: HAD family hydrolase [Candidatus Dormiibacterota bacterium]
MATKRAVLLDYGHTLVNLVRPETHILDAYRAINQRLEQELEREVPEAAELIKRVSIAVDDAIGDSYRTGAEQEVDIVELYRDALASLDIEIHPETLQWVIDQEQTAWFNGIVPSRHAPGVLATLRERGLKLCIVSNAAFPPKSMRDQLRHIGLWDYFDATVYSSELGMRKPNRAIYEEALRLLGAQPEEAVFVGDRLREDVRGPRNVGIQALLTHEFRKEEPTWWGIDVEVLTSLADLPKAIDAS